MSKRAFYHHPRTMQEQKNCKGFVVPSTLDLYTAACHERQIQVGRWDENEWHFRSLVFTARPSCFLIVVGSGAQAAQCQPLFASDTQQHHPQSGSSCSPSVGRSVEHADGGLSGGSRGLHGCSGGGGAEPVRTLRRGNGGK